MAEPTSTPARRTVVIGGGIIGVSTAVHLLRKGAPVTLVTEAELASGASGRSLSWLNSAGERSTPYHHLRMAGIERYRALAAEHPGQDWLRFDGGLYWDGDAATTAARHTYETSHDYSSRLVGPETVAAATPGIDAQSVAATAIFNPDEGWVSLPHLIAHLVDEFVRGGGTLIEHAGTARVVVSDGSVRGVATERAGDIAADAVLVACGPQTPAVVAPLGARIPDASPVSMLVTTEPAEHGLRAVLNTPRVAMRPNPGNTLALDHDWYEAAITEHPDGSYTVPRAVVDELVSEAARLIEGLPALAAASWRIGRKPIPGDGEPVFGELDQVPGCFVAFTHSGATLGLIAGELLAQEMHDGVRHPLLASFRPGRFAVRERVGA